MKILPLVACMSALFLIQSPPGMHAALKTVQPPEISYRYVIIDQIDHEKFDGIRAFLILDILTIKYNVYIIYHFLLFEDADYIVDKYDPVVLEQAQEIFPQYNLGKDSYGF